MKNIDNIEDLFLDKVKLENQLNNQLKIDLRDFEQSFLNQLTDIEKIIYIDRYYKNKSLKLIAHEQNISYAHARNISVNINKVLKLSLNFINEANKSN